ncbi:hypothetical protein C0995_000512 [Termitomyces sp. Mi166|nr:hypothetical protein C0995_000512 [Termitomyces sp. Mi166\
MEGSESGKSVLLKVPIPVEQSRAQRLERSQARFRDRGGIFVPTARNTLADILLGRKVASPKKKRGSSASLSPKKKSVKSDVRNNDEEVKAVRTSPRKTVQRPEPEAGPSRIDEQNVVSKHKLAKKFAKEVVAPTTAASKVKVDEKPTTNKRGQKPKTNPEVDEKPASKKRSRKPKTNPEVDEKPAPKKRGRRPKTTVQDPETPAGTLADHDPLLLTDSQPTTKKSRTKKSSKKTAKPDESQEDSSAETNSKPKRLAKAPLKPPLDGVATEDDAQEKKSSRSSTSKKSTASKRIPLVYTESEPAFLQQSSMDAGSSKTRKISSLENDQQTYEVRGEGSEESAIVIIKGKKKAPQSTGPGHKSDGIAVEAPPKSRKKRARPVESELECPPPPKRVKQTPSEVKSTAPRRKATKAKKETIQENEESVPTTGKDALSKYPLSKKRAREPENEQTRTKRKKTKGVVDAKPISDGAVVAESKEGNKKVEKAKKPPTSKTSRAKKGTTRASKKNESPAEPEIGPAMILIPRRRPRASVIMPMKEPQPHQIVDDDPDPINFLC